MTREEAVEVNAATGQKKRISKRIRDADFAKTEAPPQPEQAAQQPSASWNVSTGRVPETVSYTHLDVYKRQPLVRM